MQKGSLFLQGCAECCVVVPLNMCCFTVATHTLAQQKATSDAGGVKLKGSSLSPLFRKDLKCAKQNSHLRHHMRMMFFTLCFLLFWTCQSVFVFCRFLSQVGAKQTTQVEDTVLPGPWFTGVRLPNLSVSLSLCLSSFFLSFFLSLCLSPLSLFSVSLPPSLSLTLSLSLSLSLVAMVHCQYFGVGTSGRNALQNLAALESQTFLGGRNFLFFT